METVFGEHQSRNSGTEMRQGIGGYNEKKPEMSHTQTIKSTIALLSSMADSGESHSPRSKQQVWQSLKDLDALQEEIKSLEKSLKVKLKPTKEWMEKWTAVKKENAALQEVNENPGAYILRNWDEKKIKNFALHLLGDKYQDEVTALQKRLGELEELQELVKTLTPAMAEQFQRHDYRAMWDIWSILTKPKEALD